MMMTMIRTMYLARPSSGSMSTRYRIRMMTTKVMRMLMSNDMAQASHAGAALGHERARMEQVPARDRDLGEILVGAVEAGGGDAADQRPRVTPRVFKIPGGGSGYAALARCASRTGHSGNSPQAGHWARTDRERIRRRVLISVATPISTGRRVVGQVNIRRSMAGLTPQNGTPPSGANQGSPKGFRGSGRPRRIAAFESHARHQRSTTAVSGAMSRSAAPVAGRHGSLLYGGTQVRPNPIFVIAHRGPMSVDATTVRRIAHLARIAVADEEVEHLRGAVNAILAVVAQL